MTPDVPSWWTFLLLALACCRIVRLIGWDEFPPIARTRAWLVGEEGYIDSTVRRDGYVYRYKRPLLHELVTCAFCLGFWVSVVVYDLWLWQPTWTIVVAVPFALNEAVGLTSKNLDP